VAILIVKDGQQLGPFTPEEVNSQLAGGMLEPTDLGWSEDYETWTALSDMTEIVIPGDPASASTNLILADEEVEGLLPGLKTAGEETKARGGKWKWVTASVYWLQGALVRISSYLARVIYLVFALSWLRLSCRPKLHPPRSFLRMC